MSKPASIKNNKLYKQIAVTAIVTLISLVVLFVLFIFQVPQYSYHYMKCGLKQPVKVVSRGLGSDMLNYVTPASSDYQDVAFMVRGYFCTEDEARQAGLEDSDQDGSLNPKSTPSNRVKW